MVGERVAPGAANGFDQPLGLQPLCDRGGLLRASYAGNPVASPISRKVASPFRKTRANARA